MKQASATGIELVVDNPHEPDEIIAEIHGYKLRPKAFSHVISELTIAVDPDFHGQGVGKLIFSRFLELIATTRPDILRVELFTQETNTRALNLYKKLGFVVEGRMENRIRLRSLDIDISMAWFNRNYTGLLKDDYGLTGLIVSMKEQSLLFRQLYIHPCYPMLLTGELFPFYIKFVFSFIHLDGSSLRLCVQSPHPVFYACLISTNIAVIIEGLAWIEISCRIVSDDLDCIHFVFPHLYINIVNEKKSTFEPFISIGPFYFYRGVDRIGNRLSFGIPFSNENIE
jgi:putative acetyltransferase